ncbi:hypothetical protein Tco_1432821, partial [Tanacetum coccineum]
MEGDDWEFFSAEELDSLERDAINRLAAQRNKTHAPNNFYNNNNGPHSQSQAKPPSIANNPPISRPLPANKFVVMMDIVVL